MTYPPAMQQLGAKWRGVWNTKGFDKAAALASLRVTIKGTKWEHYDDVQLKALAKILRHRAKKITADQKQKANVKAARDAGRNERGELPATETRRLAWEHALRTDDFSAIDAIHAADKAADDARRNERGEDCVGDVDGAVLGAAVGPWVGTWVGACVGDIDGAVLGAAVGACVGTCVGACVGESEGAALGAAVGACVGTCVGD